MELMKPLVCHWSCIVNLSRWIQDISDVRNVSANWPSNFENVD